MTDDGKKIKVSIEWEGVAYTREDIIRSTASDVNPGDKTLLIMGEVLERMMIEMMIDIVEAN